jgi:class 3 adenylate cyclase
MDQPTEARQLLAIMFTDVVGYTALTERDEAGAVLVRDRHRELVQTLVKQFDGEVVDVTGDESLSIFPSALRAVDCALALQGALRSYPDLRLRIGVHMGDVLRRDGEVIGDGVNVAARIRPLAKPGGICISEPVYQMVRTRAHVTAQALGRQSLKNVGEAVAVYSLSLGEADTPVRPRRRVQKVLAGALATVVFGAVLIAVNRASIGTWLALNAPRFLTTPVEQQIGFAETSDGARIAYATSGTGPPVVFVLGWATHMKEGLGSPLYDLGGALRWYSEHHLVVRYDGRGFGLSDRDATDFSIDARVRDLEAVVDALGLESFALYAASAGGPTGIAYPKSGRLGWSSFGPAGTTLRREQ